MSKPKVKLYRIFALFKKDLIWISSNKSIFTLYQNLLILVPFCLYIFFIGSASGVGTFLLLINMTLFQVSGISFVLEQRENTFFPLLTTPLKPLEFLLAKQIPPFILSVFLALFMVCVNGLLYKQLHFLNPLIFLNLFLVAAIFSLMGFASILQSKDIHGIRSLTGTLITFTLFVLIFLAYSKNGFPEFPAELKSFADSYKEVFSGLSGFGASFLAVNQKYYFLNPLSHLMVIFNKNTSWPALFWHTGFCISFFVLMLFFTSSYIQHIFSSIKKSFIMKNKSFWLIFLFLSLLSNSVSPLINKEELKTKTPQKTKKISQTLSQDKKLIPLENFLKTQTLKKDLKKQNHV